MSNLVPLVGADLKAFDNVVAEIERLSANVRPGQTVLFTAAHMVEKSGSSYGLTTSVEKHVIARYSHKWVVDIAQGKMYWVFIPRTQFNDLNPAEKSVVTKLLNAVKKHAAQKNSQQVVIPQWKMVLIAVKDITDPIFTAFITECEKEWHVKVSREAFYWIFTKEPVKA